MRKIVLSLLQPPYHLDLPLSMYKIQYASDLHLEFPDNVHFLKTHPIRPVGEILLLAGDIMPLNQLSLHMDFIHNLSKIFHTVYWIGGNHEFYQNDIGNHPGKFKEKILPNVFFLNNEVIDLGPSRILCTTLWSEISVLNSFAIKRNLADFTYITNHGHPLRIHDYNDMHHESLSFLESELKGENSWKKTLIVSHHVPTMMHYPEKYAGSFLNEAFGSKQDHLIMRYQPEFWIFGHHHVNTPSFQIGNTQLLTNQLGYVSLKEQTGFSDKTITL